MQFIYFVKEASDVEGKHYHIDKIFSNKDAAVEYFNRKVGNEKISYNNLTKLPYYAGYYSLEEHQMFDKFDVEDELEVKRFKALSKLTPEERKLLGF